MSRRKQNRDIQKFIRKFFKQIVQLAIAVTKAMMQWVLRVMLVTRQPQRRNARTSGFILPTVTLLLVVVALVIGAILFRTGSRTNQVILERNQQVIYNAATPAIERAKAKLEYLFKRDDRLPNTVPPEAVLMSALLNDGQNGITQLPNNPYKLPGEEQIAIAGQTAPAWRYQTDVDGDGTNETIAYSVIFKTQNSLDPNIPSNLRREDGNDRLKANNLVVRNGPITATRSVDPDCDRLNLAPEAGWDLIGTGSLRKTFQVTAVVVSKKGEGNRTVSTLEFQQDRDMARANKWGAWFRYDMHIHPDPPLRWNGAMHTEGSLFLGGATDTSITSYLISSPKSCVYSPESNSEISIGRVKNDRNEIEFAGQVINGTINRGGFSSAKVHVQDGDQIIIDRQITTGADSTNNSPAEIALDPVILFTEDKSRGIGNRSNADRIDTASGWSNERLNSNQRIVAKTEKPPYVDDTYRADDRLGPKPRYDLEGSGTDVFLTSSLKNGTTITSASLNADQKKQLTNNDAPANDTDYKSIGLDGYWERRARAEGLRIIVGQRLELGNTYGWNPDLDGDEIRNEAGEFDPLYPIYDPTNSAGFPSSTIPHLQQQRRTLRDNLAAVQATAVYHYKQDNGNFPVACVATTAHPGTSRTTAPFGTIQESTNFQSARQYYAEYNGRPYDLYSDFFTGRGTNGWEYNIAGQGSFSGGNLRNALTNLAKFAGDHENSRTGAFPPTQEAGRVHPDPYLTMWGNFSNLRRAIEDPAKNPQTNTDSIADQSYLHTAGCAVGMLAYNANYFNQFNYGSNSGDLGTLAGAMRNLFDSNQSNGEVTLNASGLITEIRQDGNATPVVTGAAVAPTPDAFISALSPTNQRWARLVAMKEQIVRDRRSGFIPSSTAATIPTNFDHDNNASTPELKLLASSFSSVCDASTFSAVSNADVLRLLCPAQPKFPSLYYIFPDAARNANRTTGQPIDGTEPYIQRTQSIAVGSGFTPVDNAAIAAIAGEFRPKGDVGNWVLPVGDTFSFDTGNSNANDAFRVIRPDGNPRHVPILDKGIFDGRELMTARYLDVDLNRLRQNSIGGDNWLPKSGIVYAFREDAVREDAIARPASGDFTNATNITSPTDPALETNGMSRKPVDFYADPDRRAYGFRLRNGADLRRATDNPRGITFVTDNLVAIQGDFNLHSQQEFNQPLGDDFTPDNFYRDRTQLNTNFASLDNDTWRPTEILADAIGILSRDFIDGSIEDGIRRQANPPANSFGSLNAPKNNRSWVREDGSANDGNVSLPVKISRSGNPIYCSGGNQTYCPPAAQLENPSTDYIATDSDATKVGGLNDAVTPTQVNAILVGSVIPAKQDQSNGGFHNFPRFLEDWGGGTSGRPMRISGSFIQLNFSTYGTGPYDQDAWEPGATPAAGSYPNEWTYYYNPPKRVWGYDVGLQYAPAGPLSKRFITAETPRSEFYEELKANDPYVCNLRVALANSPNPAESQQQVQQECQ